MMPRLNRKLAPFLTSDRVKRVPRSIWSNYLTPQTVPLVEVWLSGDFLVQVFEARDSAQRVTVSRPELGRDARWRDKITWDELQQVKREIGRAATWAVEVYPSDDSLVDVANMRHLFLLAEAPPYAWARDD